MIVWHPESLSSLLQSSQWLNLMVCIPDYCGTKSFTWYLIRGTGLSVLHSFRGFESSRVARREGQRGGGGGDFWEGAEGREGLHHWMRCFYPGNVICLNAPCTPGARPTAVLIFLRLCCQNEPGYLWESRSAGSSCPHPRIWTGLLQFIGGQSLWNVWRQCVVKVNTVSVHINREGSVAFSHGSRGRES